jgi:hypothetical protein
VNPMMPPPIDPTTGRHRPPGPRLMTSLAVIAIGMVTAAVAVIAIAIPLVGTFTSPSYAVPGDLSLHLHHARYTVYQHSGSRSTFGSVTSDPSTVRIDPSALSIKGSDGSTVAVFADPNSETLTRGSDVYSGALVFNVPADGTYDLTFANPTSTTVVVARSLSDALHGALKWFGVGAFGGMLVVAGVVLLIVGATRRGRAKRAWYGPWGAPPAWGWPPPPPPWGPGPPPPPGPPPGPWVPPSG